MNKSLAKTGAILFVITVISKMTAFLITVVFSYFFGADLRTDAYYAAGTIPNLVNNSLTICALTLFIPVYTKCSSEEGTVRANGFAANVLNTFVIFNIILFFIVSFTAPILAKLVAPGFNEEGIHHTQNMIVLLSISFPFTVGVYTLSNLYNANQRYLFPAVATLINHIIVIVLSVLLASRFGIYFYPLIGAGAWLIQFALLFFLVRKKLPKIRPWINLRDKYLNYMLRLSIPVVITTAADQINLAADNIISSDLPSGSISYLGYAHRIFNSINGIVTATLLTIYYPIISKQYSEKDHVGLRSSLKRYFEIMLMLTLSISLILIGNSKIIIDLLLNRGAMTDEGIIKISLLFTIYVAGLLFMSLKEFSTRMFYILGNTKKPTIVNSICVAINIVLSIALKQYWGVLGIAFATTVSVAICALTEALWLLHHVGGIAKLKKYPIIDMDSIFQLFFSSLLAGLVMRLVQSLSKETHHAAILVISVMIYVSIFFVMLLLLKNDIAYSIAKRIKKKKDI